MVSGFKLLIYYYWEIFLSVEYKTKTLSSFFRKLRYGLFMFIIVSSLSVSVISQSDTMAPGGSLSSGQSLTSADGYYQLTLQSTGALVGYSVSDGTTFWSAGPSSGSAGPGATLSGSTSLPKSGSTVGSYSLLLVLDNIHFYFLLRNIQFPDRLQLSSI